MGFIKSLSVPVLSIFLFFGCSSSTNFKVRSNEMLATPTPAIQQDREEFNEVVNNFSFIIFREVWDSGHKENILISPLSISYALMMVLNGAERETSTAIKNCLGLSDFSTEEINREANSLSKLVFKPDSGVNIKLANSVWSLDEIDVEESFIRVMDDYYKAESRQFRGNDPNLPSAINYWIEEKTDGMIKDMIDNVDPSIIMMLINAISFDGLWSSSFDANNSIDAPFYISTDKNRIVVMMRRTDETMIFNGDNLDIAEIPYGDGNFVLDIILPHKDTEIDKIIDILSAQTFNNWINNANPIQTELSIPRFKYGYKIELNKILSEMGMEIAFGGRADFSGISKGYPLSIDKVTHQTFIETTEKGTEAAAATVVGIKRTAFISEERFVFNADHPFIYLIREKKSNTIIFVGLVTNPE
jgi:serine protease inhibitor